MDVEKILPPVTGFLKIKLDQEIIDYLWKTIDISRSKNKNHKNKLAGNISRSFLLDDHESFFFNSVCIPLVKHYRRKNIFGEDPVSPNALIGSKSNLVLDKLWVNYQYKNEFNPFHNHSGIYSFAIWMKIPYDWENQHKLPQFHDIEEGQRKAGNFEFEYLDTLGSIVNYAFKLSPQLEGTMLFFPATLRHCVHPFYEIEEARVSIAGNISCLPA